jgi:hypothetical protein
VTWQSVIDPGDPGVGAGGEAARAILVCLGSRPFVERLDAALVRKATPGGSAPRHRDRSGVPVCDIRRTGALTGSAGGRYRPGTVQAHHFFFMDPA